MPSERLGNVDALRAIAALLVFFQHILGDTERVAGSGPFADAATGSLDAIDLGRLGVVLFFLISGFVVPFSIKPASPIRQFVISRVFRLYPAFWASLLCLGAVLFVSGDGPDLRTLIANATMAAPVFKQAWLSGVYWTLFIEILFYALVVAMFLSGQLYRGWLVAGLAALLALSTAGPIAAWQAFGVSLPIQYVGLHLSFLLSGLLLRLWLIERQKHAPVLAAALFVVQMAAVAMTAHYSLSGDQAFAARTLHAIVLAYLAAFGIFIATVRHVPANTRLLGSIAAWSYSIYLFHGLANELVYSVVPLTGGWSDLLVAGAGLILTLLVSALVFRFIERPFIGLGRRLSAPGTSAHRNFAKPAKSRLAG